MKKPRQLPKPIRHALQLYADWKFRRIYHSHVVRDLVNQIENRLSGVRSIAPDVRAAHNLSVMLKKRLGR